MRGVTPIMRALFDTGFKPSVLEPVESNFRSWLRSTLYKSSGFNQYGLWHDDMLYQTEDVAEAERRLPDAVRHARDHRLIRAFQLSLRREILPKEQWTKMEEDIHYLRPYLDQVQREKQEIADWRKQ